MEKVESQKGFGDQRDQAETNLKVYCSQELSQEPAQEPAQGREEPSQEPSQESSLGQQKSTPVQRIIIPPGNTRQITQKVNFKIKWQTLST